MSYHRRTRLYTPGWVYMLSLISVLLLALALILSCVFGWIDGMKSVAGYINHVALALAIVVPCFLSYFKARTMNLGWFTVWIIAVVLVVVFYVLHIIPW